MPDYLYYVNSTAKTIGRVEPKEKTDTPEYIKPGGLSLLGLTRDATYLYWCDQTAHTIGRAKLDGTEVNNEWIKGAERPAVVCVNAGHVYWANQEGFIGRATIAGGSIEPKWVSLGVAFTHVIGLDSTYVYFSGGGSSKIGRVKLDGTGVETGWLETGAGTLGIFISPTHIYWGREGENFIGRAKLDGTEKIMEWVKGVDAGGGLGAYAITGDGTYLYLGMRGVGGDIARVKLDGTGLESAWVVKNAEILGVATEWQVPEPSPEPEPEPEPEPKPEPEAEAEAEAPAPAGQLLIDKTLAPGEKLTLGPYYVGGFQDHPDFLPMGMQVVGAVNLQLKLIEGGGVYLVTLLWHQRRELTAPYVEERLLLASEGALLAQQFSARGPWLTIILEARTITASARYRTIMQPVAQVYPQQRLGSPVLSSAAALAVAKEGSAQLLLPRTAPGPASIALAASGEGPTRTLLLEQLNLNGEWVHYLKLALPGSLALSSQPVVLPPSPLRATFANGTAAEIAVDLLIGAS